ncbi:MAG: hypothetical protein M0Q38_02570 [Bacteroidales bacterium]|jgi:hypothetical protein|nr:hypothetical protein [Bacteroidales bacterium]
MLSFSLVYSQKYLYFELENRFTFTEKISIRPEVNLYGEFKNQNNKIGAYFYGLANDKWGEAYGGILIPISFFRVYLGAGVESNSIPFRLNAGLDFLYKKLSLSQWYEYGGSGFWYNIQLNYQIIDIFRFGIIFKRYYGLGINLFYDIKKTPISINIAPFYDFEINNYRAMAIVRFSF